MSTSPNTSPPTETSGDDPTRRLLRLPEGGLAIGDAVDDSASTMTQQFRVRRSEVRRQVQPDKRRERKLPSRLSDAAFPTVVAALVFSPLAVDAYSAGMHVFAVTLAVMPALFAGAVSAAVSARLDTP